MNTRIKYVVQCLVSPGVWEDYRSHATIEVRARGVAENRVARVRVNHKLCGSPTIFRVVERTFTWTDKECI